MDAPVATARGRHALFSRPEKQARFDRFPPQQGRGVDEPVKVFAFRSNNRAQ